MKTPKKPRLFKPRPRLVENQWLYSYEPWMCIGLGSIGQGKTPREAYARWARSYQSRRGATQICTTFTYPIFGELI